MYGCDITYGTNNEFGFDYLRDNMKPTKEMQCQKELFYAIIDEVDSILIDEARTPLIISGPAFDDVRKYAEADRIARALKRDLHFEVKEKERTCHLTDDGVREAEHIAGLESFYTPGNMEWPHLIDNSLKAHHLYKRDRDYVVQPNGEVVIVNEFTGRLMIGRQWSDGLHQAVEAKERVKIKEENQTLATITLQNFFKLYKKLAGMTGTAMTEATEFYKVYGLDVVAIPTNRALVRVNHADVIFRYEREKMQAIIDEIKEVNASGRPVLVGTTSIEKSEELAEMLKMYGIEHQVLNAKYHEREAEIVAQAGRRRAVTIATNMAGRGTDIILGGNPEFMAWADLKRRGRRVRPAAIPDAARREQGSLGGSGRPLRARDEGRGPRGRRRGWSAHHRHGAAREPPDRQPASRPRRPPGRPRVLTVLPLARGRPDAQVRRGVGRQRADPAGHAGGRGDREPDGQPPDRGRPEEGRRAELRHPQESPRIRRGHGRATEARLLVPSEPARGGLAQGDGPGDDRWPDPGRGQPLPRRRLRRRDLRRVGRPAPGRRDHGARSEGRDLRGCRGDRPEPGGAAAQRGDSPGDGGEPPHRRRPLGMDLAGPGPLGQRAIRSQSQGTGPQEICPDRRGLLQIRPGRAGRGVERKGRGDAPEDRPVAGPRVPDARLGTPVAQRLGPSQVRPGDRPGLLGRASIAPRSSAASRARPGGSIPSRSPSCPSGSP